MQQRYFVRGADLEPRVYWRLTDNWLEPTVRFLTGVYGVSDVKDAMSREVLAGLDEAGIGLASATVEVVGLPTLRVTPQASGPGGTAGHGARAGAGTTAPGTADPGTVTCS